MSPYQDKWEPAAQDGPPFLANVAALDGHAVVRLQGELDISTVDRFTETLQDLSRGGSRQVQVDVQQLTFCDGSGLRAFEAAHNEFELAGGYVTFVGVSPNLLRLFDLTGLSGVLHVELDGQPQHETQGPDSE